MARSTPTPGVADPLVPDATATGFAMLSRTLTALGVAAVCLCAAPYTPPAVPTAAASESVPTSDRPLPSAAEFAALVQSDPVAALEASVRRYRQDVKKGFTAAFHKQERIGGKLRDPEVIRVAFKDEPFSVRMLWEKGGGLGQGTVYVRGENDGQMKVWVSRLFVKGVDPRGAMPRESARYGIEGFGLLKSAIRTRDAWAESKKAGELRVEFLGRRAIPELGGRECFVVRRTCPADEIDAFVSGEPEAVTDKNRADAFRTVTVHLDCETWLQVGTLLHRADGTPAGAYWFRDVQLDPPFDRDTFTTAAFKR